MKKRIGIILAFIFVLTSLFTAMINAKSLNENLIIKDFKFTNTDKTGASSLVMCAEGTIKASVTVENVSSEEQNFILVMQILNQGKKVIIKSTPCTLGTTTGIDKEKEFSVSHTFTQNEPDILKYEAEVFIWSDSGKMQPITTSAKFESENADMYSYIIEGNDIIKKYKEQDKTEYEYTFPEEYTGTPTVSVIPEDLGTKVEVTGSLGELSATAQTLYYKLTSLSGVIKNYMLKLNKLTPETNPKNANLASLAYNKVDMSDINTNYSTRHIIHVLNPAFDKDITTYKYYLPRTNKTKLISTVSANSVNPEAEVIISDVASVGGTATVKVTSKDGTNEKTYSVQNVGLSSFKNASYATTAVASNGTGKDYYYEENDVSPAEASKIFIGDGTVTKNGSSEKIKNERAIIGFDISGIDTVTDIALQLPLQVWTDNADNKNKNGILNLYSVKNDDVEALLSVESAASINDIGKVGGLTDNSEILSQREKAYNLCDEVLRTIDIIPTDDGITADTYYIGVTDYFNKLKAAGETVMYLGLEVKADNPETDLVWFNVTRTISGNTSNNITYLSLAYKQ